jgi:ubiquinone/menaquinone biosynthesis C-methylase UbiE
MRKLSLFRELAPFYDLIYQRKDYAAEAKIVRDVVRKHQASKGHDLLEVACGTGGHAQHLAKHFRLFATEANDGVLRIARRKVKGARFRKADMVTLDLKRSFDAVVCLFGSIGYVRTRARPRRAVARMARHLNSCGVLVIDPWFTKASFRKGTPHLDTYSGPRLKIARLCVSEVRGDVSRLDLHYSVSVWGKPVRHYVDRHELKLFEHADLLGAMRDAGLRAKRLKQSLRKGRGLYVGVKK